MSLTAWFFLAAAAVAVLLGCFLCAPEMFVSSGPPPPAPPRPPTRPVEKVGSLSCQQDGDR